MTSAIGAWARRLPAYWHEHRCRAEEKADGADNCELDAKVSPPRDYTLRLHVAESRLMGIGIGQNCQAYCQPVQKSHPAAGLTQPQSMTKSGTPPLG